MDLTLIIAIVSLLFSFVALSVMWLVKSKGNAVAFALSIVGIVSAIVALSLSAPRDLSGNCEVDYTGVIIGILGVLVTVLVGLQLYNALKIKDDAESVHEAKEVVDKYTQTIKDIPNQIKNLNELSSALNDKINSLGLKYIENPEWMWVITDSEDHILLGIKRDGSVSWSVGVPEPIRKELDALKKRIAELEKKETDAPGTSGSSPEEPEA